MPEKKFLDFSISEALISTTGEFMDKTPGVTADTSTLFNIGIGNGPSQRIGRKITVTNIYMRFNFTFLNKASTDLLTAQSGHETIRCMLVWDKQANGVGPGSTQILLTDVWDEYRNLANTKRFVILYDKIWTFNRETVAAYDGTGDSSQSVHRDWNKKISKKVFIPIEYNQVSSDGAMATIRSNNVGLILWAKLGGRIVLTASKCRIRYIDY